MPRLFVAINLPADVKAELIALQPASQRGPRRMKSDQMHLTLHFLGETDLEPVLVALRTVVALSFPLAFEGVGKFGSPQRETILWAGIRESSELQALHAAIAEALPPTGYRPETRPFSPHITLARCKPETPRHVLDEFLSRNVDFTLPEFSVTTFSLYASMLSVDGPVYVREEFFSLAEHGEPDRI